MSFPPRDRVDVAVLGGGIAALWLLDALDEAGYAAALIEPGRLGQGQTLSSQGIIHGGLKYTLRGLLHPSADAVSAMPGRWRESLSGERRPDLRAVTVRSPSTWLWRSASLRSQMAMLGARTALRTKPIETAPDERPAALASAPGAVYRVDEPVVDTLSLVRAFASIHDRRMVAAEGVDAVTLTAPTRRGAPFEVACGPSGARVLEADAVVLAAGAWNEALRARLGLPTGRMQRRPLHMTLVRGDLPELHGHCVDGAATRVTITTSTDAAGRTVWQVGGQLAESGVERSPDDLLRRAAGELAETLGSVDLRGAEWATYRIDRAELATAGGARPDDAQILEDGPPGAITLWPTKLALAPRAAERVLESLGRLGTPRSGRRPIDGPRPALGLPPWEGAAFRRLA